MPVSHEIFDAANNVIEYTLTSPSGRLRAQLLNYGATLRSLFVPDRDGVMRDVVLGWDSLAGYTGPDNRYFGATVGRVANRIRNAHFKLNGMEYELEKNCAGRHSLHGGQRGFSASHWTVLKTTDESVTLQLISPDGDEGYPAWVSVQVSYSVAPGPDKTETLSIEYTAELIGVSSPNADTIINLTNHSYFNLNGCFSQDASKLAEAKTVLSHEVSMPDVNFYLETDSDCIPSGYYLRTRDSFRSCMDFSRSSSNKSADGGSSSSGSEATNHFKSIGSGIEAASEFGYDHTYLSADPPSLEGVEIGGGGGAATHVGVVVVRSPLSGICMSMDTTEPSFQLYTAGHNANEYPAKRSQIAKNQDDAMLGKYAGLCLEAARFPDAINVEKWKRQVILREGEVYRQRTCYRFSTY